MNIAKSNGLLTEPKLLRVPFQRYFKRYFTRQEHLCPSKEFWND
jgi:hypothetical protein